MTLLAIVIPLTVASDLIDPCVQPKISRVVERQGFLGTYDGDAVPARACVAFESNACAFVDRETVILVDDRAVFDRDIVSADVEPICIFTKRRTRS